MLVRPGVAQTQAMLARELSGGSDEAARLFRQSVTLTRDIERARIELARPNRRDAARAPPPMRASPTLRASLDEMRRDQVATQARLAQFPRYRVVGRRRDQPRPNCRQLLRPARPITRWSCVDDDVLRDLRHDRDAARAPSGSALSPAELERQVDALRATISILSRTGSSSPIRSTSRRAHRLYPTLFGPVDGRAGRRHPPDLRAGRRDAPAAAQPAGHGSGRRRRLSGRAAAACVGRRLRFPRRRLARPRPRHQHRGLGARLPRRAAARRRRGRAAQYIGFGQNAPPGYLRRLRGRRAQRGRRAGPATAPGRWRRGTGRSRAAELRRRPACVGRAGRARPRSSPAAPSPTQRSRQRDDLNQYPHPPFRDPRPGHRAAAGMSRAAGAC